MRINQKQLSILRWILATSILLIASTTFADFTFNTPNSLTKVRACDDFATQELNNPWDMSDYSDINNYFPGLDVRGFYSEHFTGGKFVAAPNSTGSNLYFLSPAVCGAYPIGGRFGQNYPIDTAKYTQLSMRMYTDAVDNIGVRMIWDRNCSYANERTITSGESPLKVGWNNYTINLNTVTADTSASSSTLPWSSGSIMGFAVIPTTSVGANLSIDSVRLEDPTTCGSSSTTYTATTAGNNSLYSVWLDDDTNPFNGFVTQLKTSASATGASSANFTTSGMASGNYYLTALLDSDYATLELTNPWDMEDNVDVSLTANIDNPTFSNGAFTGTSSATTPTIYLDVGENGIDTSKYKFVTFKLSRSDNSSVLYLIWAGGAKMITYGGSDTYQVDLSADGTWTGTLSQLILRPATANGVSFSLDFVSLRGAGYDTTRSATTLLNSIVTNTGQIDVNAAPTIEIKHPSVKGGEAISAWNMNGNDFPQYNNLRADVDATYPAENYTAYLPDVRTIDGLRGDFFKGTNENGSFDPVNYSTYPFVTGPISIDTSTYKNLCFKMMTDTTFDVGGGSVARVFWSTDPLLASFNTSEDLVLIYDGWTGSRWYEYCVDMTKLYLDGTTSGNWSGTVNAFRVDPHEFTPSTTYYYDYIKLRQDDTSKGKYNIAFDLQDSDDTASTAALYYTSATSATGGTLITTVTEGQSSYLWDTSAVPSGSYLIYAVTNDTASEHVTRLATGRITINNSGISGTAPVMSLEAPTAGQTVCSTLQVKGYAVQPDRLEDVSSIEVIVDGNLFQTIYPSLYSAAAVTAYPSADSSNSGFNGLYDFTAYSNAAHTVVVKAISSDGTSTSQTFNVTKQASGCSDPITDPDPAGSPQVIPGVEKPATSTPRIRKLTQDAKGNISLMVAQVGDTDCSLSVYVGETSDAVSTLIKTFDVSSSQKKKKVANYSAAKITINPKKLKKVYFKMQKDCPDYKTGYSSAKSLKIVTKKGSKTITDFASKLTRKLKSK